MKNARQRDALRRPRSALRLAACLALRRDAESLRSPGGSRQRRLLIAPIVITGVNHATAPMRGKCFPVATIMIAANS